MTYNRSHPPAAVRIPRAEIAQIMERHGDFWSLAEDPPAEVVRHVADDYRTTGEHDPGRVAIAADLDALVDRVGVLS